MTTIGYATLQIIPSLEGVSRSINRQLAGMPDLGTAAGKQIGNNIAAGVLGSEVGKRVGKDLQSGVADGAAAGATEVQARLSERLGTQVGTVVGRGIGMGIKGSMTVATNAAKLALTAGITGAAGVASVAVGGIGVALSKGFERLQAIDEAQSKLKALGNDSATVAKIMDSALASVKGTAFGLGDAATAAASAVAAGIQPGQDLTKYLTEVGDAAAVAGTGFEDMGSIFNKIQTSNKAYTEDLQQLSDRGIPIFTWLQREYGVTADALSKMVQNGEVDSAHFQKAIADNIGGAAQTMGKSFKGAVDNAGAAIGRLGADILTPILGNKDGALGGITGVIDSITSKFDQFDTWVKAHPSDITQWFAKIGDAVLTVGQILGNTGEIALHTIGYLKTISDWTGIGSVIDLGFDPHKAADDLGTLTDKLGPLKAQMDTTAKSMGDAAQFMADMHGAAVQLDGTTITLKDNTPEVLANLDKTKFAVTTMPNGTVKLVPLTQEATDEMNAWRASQGKTPIVAPVDLNTGPASEKLNALYSQYQKLFNAPANVPPPSNAKSPQDLLLPPTGGGRATGGAIFGAGSATSDSIPAWLSNGEHVWTAAEVAKAGGQAAMYRMRAAVRRFAGGGMAMALPVNSDDDRIRRDRLPGSRTRNRSPGNDKNEIGLPEWDTPGQGWGDAPDWWWLKPIDPNDILFPDFWGQRPWGKHPLERKRIRGLGYAAGGAVGGPDVDTLKRYASQIQGGRYVRGGPAGPSGTDCSGAQAWMANFISGASGRFATATEGPALASRGFTLGDPPPGSPAYWIGWRNGGPGGGHTAGTIVDPAGGNVNVEMGGSSGGGSYGGGAGASSFSSRAWIALAAKVAAKTPEGLDAEDPNAPTALGSGSTPVGGDSGAGGSNISLPSSFSGLATAPLDNLTQAAKAKSGPGHRDPMAYFGSAASAALGGQLSSALGAFGVGDSPPALQGLSELLGQINVGGHGDSSADPLSATAASPPPDGSPASGNGSGPAPGPQPQSVVNYHINAATPSDAFLVADRREKERALKKVSVYT